jgi:Mg-chelatase subunit ChlD
LARSGLISLDPATGRIEITARLVDRFAEIALSAELRNLPSRYTFALGRTAVQQGTYERDRMKTVDEVSRMDIVESMVTSRLSHPRHRTMDDDDVRVNRELSGCSLHVVLVFDKSSSMEENDRILAAKKAVLALFKAVKRRDRRNIVDLVGFDTDVRPMDLVSVWESKPGGFTNTGAALKTAAELLRHSRSDQNLVYLITDGYPEAYTDKDGKSIAGDNDRSLASAVAEATQLRRVRNVRLVHIHLEPKERIFVDAAEKIVGAAHGKLITTDPNRLAAEMLTDYTAA